MTDLYEKQSLQNQREIHQHDLAIRRRESTELEAERRRDFSETENSKQRDHASKMYDRKRSDLLIDQHGQIEGKASSEREVTRRLKDLAGIQHRHEQQNRSRDFEDFVAREDIALQAYQKRAEIDDVAQKSILREEGRTSRAELREHLRKNLAEATITLLADRNRMKLENELKKDFKTHGTDEFIRLKRAFGHLTPDEQKQFFTEFDADIKRPPQSKN